MLIQLNWAISLKFLLNKRQWNVQIRIKIRGIIGKKGTGWCCMNIKPVPGIVSNSLPLFSHWPQFSEQFLYGKKMCKKNVIATVLQTRATVYLLFTRGKVGRRELDNGKEEQIYDDRRNFDCGWFTHNARRRRRIIRVCAWNLYNCMNQWHPNKLNFKNVVLSYESFSFFFFYMNF